MMKRTLLFFVFFLLVIPMVSSQPPFQVSEETSGINIAYPKNTYLLEDNNVTLHFHIYNSSGYVLTNDTTDCNIHVYNTTGNHVLEEDLLFDSNDVDFYIGLNTTFTSSRGFVPYLIYCNNSVEAGFVSGSFLVAVSEDYDSEKSLLPVAMLILVPVILGIILIFCSWSLESEEHNALKIFLLLLSIACFIVSLYFGLVSVIHFYDFPVMQEAIGNTTFWYATIFSVVIIYFLIYIIKISIEQSAQKKKVKIEY